MRYSLMLLQGKTHELASDLLAGTGVMAVFHLVPDDVMSWTVKIFVSIVTAFVGGFFYHLGKWLFDKLTKKTPPPSIP